MENSSSNVKKSKNIAPRRERNYASLFKLLERHFPGWVDHFWIQKVGSFDFLMEKDLKSLVKSGFLEQESFDAWDEKHNKLGYKTIHYRLSPQGFNFLNSLRNRTTNNILLILTVVMTIMAGIQIYLLVV